MSSSTPYDNVFRTLLDQCPRLVVPLINELFDEANPRDLPIVLRKNGHYRDVGGKQKEVVSDSNILVVLPDRTAAYHLECQSTTDRSMTRRMFEYDTSIAMEGAARTADGLEVRFPRSGVIYLRKGPKSPEEVRIVAQAPGEHDWKYRVRAASVVDLTLDELFDKFLLILIPFHLFAHERRLAHYNEDDEALAGFLEECAGIRDRLEELALSGEIDEYTKRTLVDMTSRVAEHMARKFNRVVEGVRQVMGGQVLEYEARTIRDNALAEGEATGIAKGQLETLAKLVSRRSITVEEAAEVAGMTVEEFERKAAAVA